MTPDWPEILYTSQITQPDQMLTAKYIAILPCILAKQFIDGDNNTGNGATRLKTCEMRQTIKM